MNLGGSADVGSASDASYDVSGVFSVSGETVSARRSVVSGAVDSGVFTVTSSVCETGGFTSGAFCFFFQAATDVTAMTAEIARSIVPVPTFQSWVIHWRLIHFFAPLLFSL